MFYPCSKFFLFDINSHFRSKDFSIEIALFCALFLDYSGRHDKINCSLGLLLPSLHFNGVDIRYFLL